MLTLLILFGVLLCCLRLLRFQFLRQQQLQNLRERFLWGYQNPDGNQQEMNPMSSGHNVFNQQHCNLKSGRMHIQTLHCGRYPSAIYFQRDLHHNLQRDIERSTLEHGLRRPSNTPRNSPASSPWRRINLGEFNTTPKPRARLCKPATISTKHVPTLSSSSQAAKRRICRGRARHLRSEKTSNKSLTILPNCTPPHPYCKKEHKIGRSIILLWSKDFITSPNLCQTWQKNSKIWSLLSRSDQCKKKKIQYIINTRIISYILIYEYFTDTYFRNISYFL